MLDTQNKENLAYIIGVSIGDGNLSNPNKRAVRLRITCDNKYPSLIENIKKSLQILAPQNKVSLIKRSDSCTDISCYSNDWEGILGWKSNGGPKHKQEIKIPKWILKNKKYSKRCLKGLFETDGSIYRDRSYIMINFTSIIENVMEDVIEMLKLLGYSGNLQINESGKNIRYTLRISKNSEKFIEGLNIRKQ